MHNNTTFDPARSQDENGDTLHPILLVLSQHVFYTTGILSSSFLLVIRALIMTDGQCIGQC